MSEKSKIEWCDSTWNPWEGCQKVGPGCDHCYAEVRNARFGGGTAPNWGPGALRRRTSVANWRKPLAWNADAARFMTEHGRRQRVFCASLADVFDNAVDPEWRRALGAVITATPDLDWLLLTKRIGNATVMVRDMFCGPAPANVIGGATMVNQAEVDRDWDKLMAAPFQRRFASMEPLLGPIDFPPFGSPYIDWIIVGGESGPGARPMHPAWARSLRDQCTAGDVPFLFKQWGEWGRASSQPSGTPGRYAFATAALGGGYPTTVFSIGFYPRQFDLFGGASVMEHVGKKRSGRLLDGVQHDGMPA